MSTDTTGVTKPKFKFPDTLKNFWVDLILLIFFLLEMNLQFTGLDLHEWIGLVMGGVVVIHLLFHWKWIVAVGQRLIRKLPAIQRIKYIVDILIFVDMVVIIATGIWISEVVMRQLGLSTPSNFFWRWLHTSSADWEVWLVGLHLALNWQWVVATLKRYFWHPLTQGRRQSLPATGEAQ